jgi:beta-glucosidase
VEATVKNVGKRAGKEIVQLYVREQNPEIPRPDKELKAFAKVFLEPGESRKLVFEVPESSLGFWDVTLHRRRVSPGLYDILVGSSSRDFPLLKTLRVKGDMPIPPRLTEESMLKDFARHPKGKAFLGQMQKATGLVGAIGKDSRKAKLSEREKADILKAQKALMAFLNEMPASRIRGFSEGKFGDEALRKILRKT